MEKQTETQKITPSTTENKGNKTNKLLVVVIVLLLGFCGFLIWQNLELQKNLGEKQIEYVDMSSEKDRVQAELEDMLAQYDALETTNETIKGELEAEKAKIEDLLKKMKGKDWTIYQLKKETETLRTIMKGFVVQIDSLNTANQELKAENTVVRNELSTEKNKSENLSKENEGLSNKVTIASYLKTVGLNSYGVRVKSDNTGKENDRAKKIDKIRTTFTVQKNEITPPGNKTIYVRILTPDGKVLSEKTDDSNKFDFNGIRGLFSSKKDINYQNKEVELTIDWVKTDEFPVGEYNVEVYADGVDIGKTKFTLK
jgi:FtsZ-binding cell division protein ZapB